jgi:hypothetical protein
MRDALDRARFLMEDRMKPLSLKVLSAALLVGSLIAWWFDASRKIEWTTLFVLGFAVSVVAARFSELERRVARLETGQAPR